MPKSDDQFRYSDWKWIAVHFLSEEREDMARTAWLIAQCSADDIAKHKQLDPRIVIPLCAIEFQDEINWEKLRELNKQTQQIDFSEPLRHDINDFLNFLNNRLQSKKDQQIIIRDFIKNFILNSIDQISHSKRWINLFLSLELNLQIELLYCLSNSYRRLEHDDWRNCFVDSKYQFITSWHYLLVLSSIFLFISFCIIAMNTIIFKEHNFWISLLIGIAFYILIGFWVSSLQNPKYFIRFGLFGLLTFQRELYQLLRSNPSNLNIDKNFNNIIATEAVVGIVAGNLLLTGAVAGAVAGAGIVATVVSVPVFAIWIGALLGKVSFGMASIWTVTGIFILAGVGIVTGAAGATTVAMVMSLPVFVVGFGGLFGEVMQGRTLILAAGSVAMTEAGTLVGTVAGASTVALIGSVAVFVLAVGAFFRRVSWIWVMAIAMIGTLILARVVAGASSVAMVGVRFGIFTGVLLSMGKLSWYGRKDNQNYFHFLTIFTFPLFCWFPILVSFATIFLLRFFSWQYTLLIWLISFGTCTGLWLYGQDKERKARNPLKGIL